ELAREAGSFDGRDELRRWKDAAGRMPPAHQRLGREERAVLERDDRLVVKDELVLEDRLLELELRVDAHRITLPARPPRARRPRSAASSRGAGTHARSRHDRAECA